MVVGNRGFRVAFAGVGHAPPKTCNDQMQVVKGENSMGLLFKGGTVVTATEELPVDVLVEGEKITTVASEVPAAGHEVVECDGMLLLPGGVDVHTHLDLPLVGTHSNDDFDSGHRAAAFGGTTTHIDFAIQPVGGTMAEGLKIWQKKAELAQIDYGFHMTITDPRPQVIDAIPTMLDEGITSIKILMAYKNIFQVDDTGLYRTMRVCATNGMLVMVHAENGDVEALIREELVNEGKLAPVYHAASRPPEIEAEATNRAVMMAGLTGCALYVVHMTNAGSVEALRRGRQAGYPVMGETCPQYLTLTVDDHLAQPDFHGAKYVCSPPIRTQADHEALWLALRDGALQAFATDHCDFWWEGGIGPWQAWGDAHPEGDWAAYEAQDPSYRRPGKEMGRDDFSKMPNGLPGIEDRLYVLWQLGVNTGRISRSRFVELCCTNPAKIYGLYPRKGTIAPGADADLLVWDPAHEHTLSAATHHMKTDYNCYEGLQVTGKPVRVYQRGKLLVDGEAWHGKIGGGHYLPREPYAPIL